MKLEKKGLTRKELEKILKIWQKRLLLSEWDISIKIIEFKRKDYKQSGDVKVSPKKKEASILLTNNPFRNEESVLVHELVHLILWDYDIFNEKLTLKNSETKLKGKHKKYMEKLESTVDHLTKAFLKNIKTTTPSSKPNSHSSPPKPEQPQTQHPHKAPSTPPNHKHKYTS